MGVISKTGELSADGRTLLWTGYVTDTDKGRRQVYGLKQEQFEAILAEQEGRCYWCLRDFGWRQKVRDGVLREVVKTSPCVDHDHVTAEIYGLLCDPCNRRRKAVPADPPARRAAGGPFFVPKSRMAAMERRREQRTSQRRSKKAKVEKKRREREAWETWKVEARARYRLKIEKVRRRMSA